MTPEEVARQFHRTYERLAPSFGYKTREASAVPWEQVPEQNRALMVAVAAEVMTTLPIIDPLVFDRLVEFVGSAEPAILDAFCVMFPNEAALTMERDSETLVAIDAERRLREMTDVMTDLLAAIGDDHPFGLGLSDLLRWDQTLARARAALNIEPPGGGPSASAVRTGVSFHPEATQSMYGPYGRVSDRCIHGVHDEDSMGCSKCRALLGIPTPATAGVCRCVPGCFCPAEVVCMCDTSDGDPS